MQKLGKQGGGGGAGRPPPAAVRAAENVKSK